MKKRKGVALVGGLRMRNQENQKSKGKRGPAKGSPQRGGVRKGYKQPKTLEKLAHEALVRAMVAQELGPLTEAQIRNAAGIKHLMFRDPKTGKFERVTDEEQMDEALASEGETHWIYTKDPSVQAYTEQMNRSYGKPTERLQAEISHDAGPKLEILLANLKRIGNGHGS